MNTRIAKTILFYLTAIATLSLSPAVSAAERVGTFENTVKHAVVNNPEVQAAFHNLEASGFALRGAKGGFLPRLDLTGEYGESRLETPTFNPEDSFKNDEFRLILTQMLFDGFGTWHRVKELSHTQRAAYFQLKQVSEEVALEAARAYYDVMRYQALVRLAEANLEEHHRIYKHVEQRTGAGVSRGVDLEQANARLALADFNLLQEVTNLHDVVARFHRVVTALPEDNLTAPKFPVALIPESRMAALDKAYAMNPALQRAIARVEAAQSATKAARAPFMPQLDLRLRAEDGHDLDGVFGDHEEEAVELVFRYNLYNGGSDSAARKEAINRHYEAQDLRTKTCHDVRQNVVVAYNDITSIEQRLVFLARNELSIEKARMAYRRQFDIGKRTLLDLLDSENEYFDVSRQLVNAQHDLAMARMRTLAGMGNLTEAMNAKSPLIDEEYGLASAGCPPESGPDMSAYFNRKQSLLDSLRAGEKKAYRMDVRFKFDSDKVDPSYDQDLKDAAQYLVEVPTLKAQIVGHTDSVGSEEYNMNLSKRRAESVKDLLIKKYKIAPERLEAVGKGEGSPVAENGTRQGRAQNRRVELVPIKPDAKK